MDLTTAGHITLLLQYNKGSPRIQQNVCPVEEPRLQPALEASIQASARFQTLHEAPIYGIKKKIYMKGYFNKTK